MNKMKNRYEFKIEDINTVKAVSVATSDNFTTTYTRRDKLFITTYTADIEESKSDRSKEMVICNRCGSWNSLNKGEYDENNFICSNCYNLAEHAITEEKLIEIVLSFLDEEVFFDIELYINDKKIE